MSLIEIEAEVDPYLEIAEIHRRVIEEQGKALFLRMLKVQNIRLLQIFSERQKGLILVLDKSPQEFVKKAVEMVDVLAAAETQRTLAISQIWLYSLKTRDEESKKCAGFGSLR